MKTNSIKTLSVALLAVIGVTAAKAANTASLTQDGVTTEYQDFECAYVAIDEAKGDAVIKLLGDYSYTERKTFTKAFTIDLNGHTLEGSAAKYSAFNVQNNLTICDTSANQEGKVLASHCTAAAFVIGTSAGAACSLTVESGCIQSETAIFDTWDNVAIAVNGGKLVSFSQYGAGDSRSIIKELCSGCSLIITGGEFRSDQSAKAFDTMSFDPMGFPTKTINANSTITVTGGTFSGQAIQKYVPGYTADQSFSADQPTITVGDYTITRSTVSSPYGAAPYDVFLYTVAPVAVPAKEVKVYVADTTAKVVDESGNAKTATAAEQELADGKKATAAETISENTVVANMTDTGVTTVAKDSSGNVKSAVVTALKAATTDADVAAAITSSSEVESYIKVALASAKVMVSGETASLKSLVFDVTPKTKTTVTVGDTETVVEATVPNSEITSALTFRLPLTDDFTVSALVQHEGDPDRILAVQGTTGQRFVELAADHFSEFTVTPTDIATLEIESSTSLGVVRHTGTAGTEVAIGVPFASASSSGAVKVSEIITTGLTEGDQLSVWDVANKTYDVWQWSANGGWTAALDAEQQALTTKTASETTVASGCAVWYKPAGGKTYSLVGRPQDSCSTEITAGSTTAPKYSLLANPYPAVVKLTNIAGASGDQILSLETKTSYTHNGTTWCTGAFVTEDAGFGLTKKVWKLTAVDSTVTIPANAGFWYISLGGTPTINWETVSE